MLLFMRSVWTPLVCYVSLAGLIRGARDDHVEFQFSLSNGEEWRHGPNVIVNHSTQKKAERLFKSEALIAKRIHSLTGIDVVANKATVREAVIVLMRKLDNSCLSRRLLALSRSASSDEHPRHVWLLHDKQHPPRDAALISELVAAGLRIAPQPDEPPAWPSFAGGYHSGGSKPAFLKFAQRHSEYDFFWHIEEDAFYTGSWHVFFDSVWNSGNGSADVVASNNLQRKSWIWLQHCQVLGEPCLSKGRTPLQTLWPAARYSHRFASGLAESLSTAHGTNGHHEAVTGLFCAASAWCSMAKLQQMGVYEAVGGIGTFAEKKSNQFSLEFASATQPPYHVVMDRIYHPVKCEASATLGDVALQYAQQKSSTDDAPS